MTPYGLGYQVPLAEAFTTPPTGITYDPGTQLNMVNGRPLVKQPDLMIQYSVTWNTTSRDNKTDDGG
jgi:putative ATP-grasp target RiPP